MVQVTGVDKLTKFLSELPSKIMGGVKSRFEQTAPTRLEGLRGTIQAVVYDAYQPTHYRRRADRPLIAATEAAVGGDISQVEMSFSDNPEGIEPIPRPRGGSSLDDVPWEIELGRYPIGPGMPPRPAYQIYRDKMEPEIVREVDEIIRSKL